MIAFAWHTPLYVEERKKGFGRAEILNSGERRKMKVGRSPGSELEVLQRE